MSDDIDRTNEVRELAAEDQRREATARNGQHPDDHRLKETPADASLLAGMFTGAWLDQQEFPPLEYAVPGIIPEGFGVLAAPPKTARAGSSAASA